MEKAYVERKESKQNKKIKELFLAINEISSDTSKTSYANITKITQTNETNITKNSQTLTSLEEKIKLLEEENKSLKEKNKELQEQVTKINHIENRLILTETKIQESPVNDLPETMMTLSMALWSLSRNCSDETKTSNKLKTYLSSLFNRNLDITKLDQLMASCGFTKKPSKTRTMSS